MVVLETFHKFKYHFPRFFWVNFKISFLTIQGSSSCILGKPVWSCSFISWCYFEGLFYSILYVSQIHLVVWMGLRKCIMFLYYTQKNTMKYSWFMRSWPAKLLKMMHKRIMTSCIVTSPIPVVSCPIWRVFGRSNVMRNFEKINK